MSKNHPMAAGGSGLPAEDLDVFRSFFTEIARVPEARGLFAQMMVGLRQDRFRAIAEPGTAEAVAVAQTLATEGIADLGALVEPPRVADMLAHFKRCAVYAGHVNEGDGEPVDFEALRQTTHYGCYAPDDIIRCPHLLELANDPRLLQIAETYLGCPPTIYSLNAWWSFARSGVAAQSSQSLHRDLDDFRFLTLFLYLTPVGLTNGAHRYIRYSHDKAALMRQLDGRGLPEPALRSMVDPLFLGDGYQAAMAAETLLAPFEMVWTGPAGSSVIADTYGLHMGIPLTEGERLMVWVRYGLGPNTASFGGRHRVADVDKRIPLTARSQYINRLLLDVAGASG